MKITIIFLVLLVSLLPNQTFTSHVGIVNGRKAKPHSRPYMVSLQLDGDHVCGGSLISDQFVLTAAHCWCQGQTLMAVVGAHDISNRRILNSFRVKSYIVHPKYRSNLLRNDIMLLKLETRAKLNNNTGLISLPSDGENIEAGAHCSVAGWGDLWTGGPPSNRLREANTTTISGAECERKWGLAYEDSQMICAHGSGGSCHGDSGGPLVCGDTAVGVTSFGSGGYCNSPDHPNVYTKILAYLPWIRKVIGK